MIGLLLQLIAVLLFLGVLAWAIVYLGTGYIDEAFLAIIRKLIIVVAVIVVMYFLLALIGLMPAPDPWWPPRRN